MEHRWGERMVVDTEVRLSCVPYDIGIGSLRDVSISGAFIETSLRLPVMAMVHVRWRSRGAGHMQRHCLAGHIVRRIDAGFGVEWLDLAPLAVVELLKQHTRAVPYLDSTSKTPAAACEIGM